MKACAHRTFRNLQKERRYLKKRSLRQKEFTSKEEKRSGMKFLMFHSYMSNEESAGKTPL